MNVMPSVSPPSMPPRQGPSPSILSSPAAKCYDEYKCDKFGYDVVIHEPEVFTSPQTRAFLQFLHLQKITEMGIRIIKALTISAPLPGKVSLALLNLL